MLTVAKIDRYDMVNNPGDDTASVTIWFSGCNFQCKGCHNPRLQDAGEGDEFTLGGLFAIVTSCLMKCKSKYVVLLGGEPLHQDQQELLLLCRLLDEAGYKVWLYTGYNLDEVPQAIIQHLYTIKCGQYIESLRQDGFPASSNQKVYRHIAGDLIDITNSIGGNKS